MREVGGWVREVGGWVSEGGGWVGEGGGWVNEGGRWVGEGGGWVGEGGGWVKEDWMATKVVGWRKIDETGWFGQVRGEEEKKRWKKIRKMKK